MWTKLILALMLFWPAGTVSVSLPSKGLFHPKVVAAFYDGRNFTKAWSDPKLIQQLQEAIAQATQHGLRPENYHFKNLINQEDAFLTDAFIAYAHDLRFGRASHPLKGQDWKITHNDQEFVGVLEHALATGQIRKQLADLAPSHELYRSLQTALAQYRHFAASGGWPVFQSSIDLQESENPELLDLLRRRLALTKDFHSNMELIDAVIAFQQRHGLRVDGIVGKETIGALSMSAGHRVLQLELSLERLRWMPREFPERFIIVNVPGLDLRIVQQKSVIQTMRIIAGKTTWCTPTFLSSEIDQIILNPYWYVPSMIAKKEIFPLLQEDPQYLKKNNIDMISRNDGSIQLRQSPGPRNALGRIKFIFPNCCDCYLHDTPEKELFERVLRFFSHGCIRIERAIDLGNWILEEEDWSAEKLTAAIEGNKTQTIWLTKPIPIFIVYFTAWIEEDGSVQFRNDVYGKDRELIRGLDQSDFLH